MIHDFSELHKYQQVIMDYYWYSMNYIFALCFESTKCVFSDSIWQPRVRFFSGRRRAVARARPRLRKILIFMMIFSPAVLHAGMGIRCRRAVSWSQIFLVQHPRSMLFSDPASGRHPEILFLIYFLLPLGSIDNNVAGSKGHAIGEGRVKTTRQPTSMDKLVGQRIRLARKIAKLSQTKLAEGAGVTYQQIQKYENGTDRVGAGRLFQIAQLTDQPIAFFFTTANEAGADAPGEDILADPHMQKLIGVVARVENRDLIFNLVKIADTFAMTEDAAD